MNSFLLTIAGILILALSAAFAVPYFVDWGEYRYVFEAQASRLAGRTVGVGGDVRLRLLPTPILSFDGVQIANAKGGFEQPFAKAESLTVWLSVAPLLSGSLVARKIEIQSPEFNLSVDGEGRGNWHDIGAGSTGALPFAPDQVALDKVDIVDATLNLRRSGDQRAWTVKGLSGELSAASLEGPFKFAGTFRHGEFEERELRFSTTRGEEDGTVRLKGVVRDGERTTNYSVNGTIAGFGDRPTFKGTFDARFLAQGDPLKLGAEGIKVPIEIKSKVSAGLGGAKFEALEATIKREDRPQTINAVLDASWGNGLRLDGTIGDALAQYRSLDRWRCRYAPGARQGPRNHRAKPSRPVPRH